MPSSTASCVKSSFSTIEYANKSVLLDLVNHLNIQLPSKYDKDVLDVLVSSHLFAGECKNSAADGCMQLVTSLCARKFEVDSLINSLSPYYCTIMPPVFTPKIYLFTCCDV